VKWKKGKFLVLYDRFSGVRCFPHFSWESCEVRS